MEYGDNMKPSVIFVETNWLVEMVKPSYLQTFQANRLLSRAEAGEFELYLPAICLAEARETIKRRFSRKTRPTNNVREFVTLVRDNNRITWEESNAVLKVLDMFDSSVKNELKQVPDRLNELARNRSINVFPLSETMLERQVSIGASDIFLEPFDLAILSAILVKAEELQQEGHSWVGFCELDSDLQPWYEIGRPKSLLNGLYQQARVWVYGDFLVEDIDGFPDRQFESTE